MIVDNPSYEPKSIICAVEEEFKYKISYNKAYRAKQKALEMRWGTYEASYHNIPALLHTNSIAIARCVVFRTYLVITRLLARGIGVARISRKSKKEVQHHMYRLIFKYVCLVVLLFLIILNHFLFAKVRW